MSCFLFHPTHRINKKKRLQNYCLLNCSRLTSINNTICVTAVDILNMAGIAYLIDISGFGFFLVSIIYNHIVIVKLSAVGGCLAHWDSNSLRVLWILSQHANNLLTPLSVIDVPKFCNKMFWLSLTRFNEQITELTFTTYVFIVDLDRLKYAACLSHASWILIIKKIYKQKFTRSLFSLLT